MRLFTPPTSSMRASSLRRMSWAHFRPSRDFEAERQRGCAACARGGMLLPGYGERSDRDQILVVLRARSRIETEARLFLSPRNPMACPSATGVGIVAANRRAGTHKIRRSRKRRHQGLGRKSRRVDGRSQQRILAHLTLIFPAAPFDEHRTTNLRWREVCEYHKGWKFVSTTKVDSFLLS